MKYFTQKNILYLFGVVFAFTAVSLLAEWDLISIISGLFLVSIAAIYILTIIWERKDRPRREKITWTTTLGYLLLTIFLGVLGAPLFFVWLSAICTAVSGGILFYLLAKGR